jgi:hypothetical protein
LSDTTTVYDGVSAVDTTPGDGLSFRLVVGSSDPNLDVTSRFGSDVSPRYGAFPTSSAQTIASTSTDSSGATRTSTVFYSIRAAASQPSGQYTGQLLYSAVTNP